MHTRSAPRPVHTEPDPAVSAAAPAPPPPSLACCDLPRGNGSLGTAPVRVPRPSGQVHGWVSPAAGTNQRREGAAGEVRFQRREGAPAAGRNQRRGEAQRRGVGFPGAAGPARQPDRTAPVRFDLGGGHQGTPFSAPDSLGDSRITGEPYSPVVQRNSPVMQKLPGCTSPLAALAVRVRRGQ